MVVKFRICDFFTSCILITMVRIVIENKIIKNYLISKAKKNYSVVVKERCQKGNFQKLIEIKIKKRGNRTFS